MTHDRPPAAIRLTRSVYESYRATIAKHPPETFALLGGSLDDYLVTDFRFCPPARTAAGHLDAGPAHINIDPDLLNWIVDNEWRPNGKYMLGIWHSHPGSSHKPSLGNPVSCYGDIPFFTACLRSDDSPGRRWSTFLAPITTFAPDGSDTIHGWTLTRGDSLARPCPVLIEEPTATTSPAIVARAHSVLASAELRVRLVRELMRRYARELESIANDASLSRAHRAEMATALQRLRASEIRDLCDGHHPLSRLLATFPELPPDV